MLVLVYQLSDKISQPELSKSIVGEAVEVVSQVLKNCFAWEGVVLNVLFIVWTSSFWFHWLWERENALAQTPWTLCMVVYFFPFSFKLKRCSGAQCIRDFFGSILCSRRQGAAGTTVLNAWITIQADCVLFQTVWLSVICLYSSPGVFPLLLLYSATPSVK